MTAKGNNLTTTFVFEDAQLKKVDALHKKLLEVNNSFNNLKGSTVFGKTIVADTDLAGKSVDKLKKTVQDFKTTSANETFKPTISRHWENEAAAVAKSTDKIKTETDKLKNTVYTPGQPTGFAPTTPTTPTTKPDGMVSDFLKKSFADAERLEKKTGEIKKSFQDIAAVKINSGNIGHLTKEIVNASENSRNLQRHIASIKKEIANPNRKTSISVLTDDLRVAQSAADVLNRKLSALPTASGAVAGKDAVGRPTGLQLSGFQKTNLSYQINDIATMAAMGANPTQIIASQAGQIAQIFSAEQVAAFTAKYAALLPILGLGSAALLLTYKITGDIRDAAERRLKTEEKITATLNNQRLAAGKLTDEFNKQRKDDAERRRIQYFQEDNPIEQIRGRKALLEQLLSMRANDTTQQGAVIIAQFRNELSLLDNQLQDFDRKRKLANLGSADTAFDQRKSDFKKNQEVERLADEKRLFEAAEKFKKSVEEGREKVKELGKTFTETFDNLFQKTNQSNPFVAVFSEADKSLKALRENIKGLPADLQTAALGMQNNLNANALFSARLDNALNAFDLQDGAANFRNFREVDPLRAQMEKFNEDPAKSFKDFTEFYTKQIEKQTGGSFLGYAKNATFGGTTSYDLRDGLNFAFDKVANIGGTIRRQKDFTDLSETEKQNYLSSVNRVDETKNLSLQNRLDKQFSIINSLGAANPEQTALANRKIISLTQGVDPSQLTSSQREQAALASEREAVRLENAEREASRQRQEQIKLQTRIAVNQEALLKLVNEKGLAGINEFLLTVKDETAGGATVLGASPKPSDMPQPQNLGLVSGSGGLTNF